MIPLAMLLMATSIALYIVEYFWKIEYLAGSMAALLLVTSAWIQSRFPKPLFVTGALFLGLVMAWLCRTAKRARLNKTHDL
jgi:F0F1-type ATP synthase assembly protein I